MAMQCSESLSLPRLQVTGSDRALSHWAEGKFLIRPNKRGDVIVLH